MKLYICLVHYPVKNQHNEIITTSVTNLDVHDLARVVATYDLSGYYIVQPILRQKELFNNLIEYWTTGTGAYYNPDRSTALKKVKLVSSIDQCLELIPDKELLTIATGAKLDCDVSFTGLRSLLETKPVLLLFGTGWGLADETIKNAHYRLEPIEAIGFYNHLSVRSAASIIIDRLCAKVWWGNL